MSILQNVFKKTEERDLQELITEGAIIIDVRSPAEFAGGHVAGAINVPLETLPAAIEKVAGKDTTIITCCMSGGRSAMAKTMLHTAGYQNVYNGGGWQTLQSKLQ